MKRVKFLFAALLASMVAAMFCATTVFAASQEVQRIIESAAPYCKDFENGEFDQGDAVTEIELRSQFGTATAELVDESQYSCSSAASMYCGTGGCMFKLIVDGKTMS